MCAMLNVHMDARQPPYDYEAHIKNTSFMPAEQYLSKLTTSHFNTLNMQIGNQNVLEMLLIAM